MDKAIIVSGQGGQGIKFMSTVLGKLFMSLGKEVAITFSYDAAMRGGNITAFISISDSAILNPLPENYDISVDSRQFVEKAIALGSKTFTGMVILGSILKSLDVMPDKVTEVLPERNREENIRAVRLGYGK
ncbi:MAG: 2-oxoacid:acceptor oxidoreductase family protein [Candidatus Woesearchaeota archaeon]